ncbi:MAG: hypothetical protein JO168_03370 [Solirubrobacterales bacterium]|nr:hypothetical protein [Solirubrobacterales bacterium]MBV9716354.1 hypothetical protein [Solirubrobacterales bacterium]
MPARAGHLRGEIVSAISALLLAVTMFALAWYGVDGVPGRTARLVGTENAWQGLSVLRWLMLATIVAALAAAPLRLGGRSNGARPNTGALVMLLGTATSAVLIYRVLIALPSPDEVVDQKLGAFLAVVWALGIAYGGLESLRDERAAAAATQARMRSA